MGGYCNTASGINGLGFWCFIYDFQALVTGALAVLIALIALIPVWRQLRDSNLQTRISRRGTLADMLRAGLRRFAKVEEALRNPLRMAVDATMDPLGDAVPIDAEAAHHLEQVFARVLDWYLVVLAETEAPEIEACKSDLKVALDALVETLADAHWAEHNDQQQDELYIPDAKWAEIEARCAAAKLEAAQKVLQVSNKRRALTEAQETWARSLRERIAELDRAIAAS